jgi:hypothetical protein
MGSSASRREVQRTALLRLQRLLWSAEASLSSGARSGQAALDQLADAFDLFRRQFQTDFDASSATPEDEQRRWALMALARVLLEMDRAVAQGDQEGIVRALGHAKTALAASQVIDDSSHMSGVRRRPVGDE